MGEILKSKEQQFEEVYAEAYAKSAKPSRAAVGMLFELALTPDAELPDEWEIVRPLWEFMRSSLQDPTLPINWFCGEILERIITPSPVDVVGATRRRVRRLLGGFLGPLLD